MGELVIFWPIREPVLYYMASGEWIYLLYNDYNLLGRNFLLGRNELCSGNISVNYRPTINALIAIASGMKNGIILSCFHRTRNAAVI